MRDERERERATIDYDFDIYRPKCSSSTLLPRSDPEWSIKGMDRHGYFIYSTGKVTYSYLLHIAGKIVRSFKTKDA